MKCMVIEEFGAPLVIKERSVPDPDKGEAIVKVGACGVCRTDLKIWQGNSPVPTKLPLVLGHEIAGEIVEVADGLDTSRIGERVIVNPYLSCGNCKFCKKGQQNLCSHLRGVIGVSRDGGYSEYVKVPLDCLFPISRDISFEQAAIIPDAIATSYHALVKKAQVERSQTIVVLGVGGLGLHAVQIGVALGARVIAMDIKPEALKLAREMGAEKTVNITEAASTEEIMEIPGRGGADAVIDFTGNTEMEDLAIRMLGVAGRFVAVGYTPNKTFQVNSLLLVSKELEMYGSRACNPDDVRQAIEWVSIGKLKPFISEIHPLIRANLVLERLEKGDTLGRSVLIP